MKKVLNKVLAATMTISMLVGMTACGGEKTSSDKLASTDGSYKSITTTMNMESGTLDSAGITSYWWWSYTSYATAPLVELAEDGTYKNILAESYEVNDDMTQYTFHIRQDASWNNGDAVTSADFLNTITRALDPDCGNGYSTMLLCIEGADAIYNEGADVSTLGVECPDDKTIVFNLTDSTAYFMDLLTLPVFIPTHRELQTETNGAWSMGEDMDALVSCGPFYMAEYVPNQYCLYKKNESYVLADEIHLDEIKTMAMEDTQAIISAYKTGELDIATADYTVLEEYADSDELVKYVATTSNYELFDITEAPFDDVRVREAFSISIDRDAVATACGTNYLGTTFFVGSGVVSKASGKTWAEEAGGDLLTFDVERAQELLAEAGYPNGEGFPTVTYKYPSTQIESDIAQALQAQWKENLGIEVQLEAQETQVNISDRRAGDFDICRMQWTADFVDPYTYLSMYRTSDSYNDNGTNCTEYDELMEASNKESDPVKRYELLHEAEKVLVAEYFWAIPVLNRETIVLMNTKLTNRIIDPSRGNIRTKYLDIAE
ncbi:MAG: peptide ABC transporter substrate-binding protein [Butyrivibrio sp.]|uniref:peptide ABC transporter substrate-binding protein n=1 Tax=Butyrivibrio sp. TaxID=28121 RepID=UPI0025CB99DB|nr:peptide ABC transporter substrate-binding protein [Butyrivibrio sp.]MCR5769873.1 peptide ABC transporter substrate-binding protein [Butyrivibrio sp.]